MDDASGRLRILRPIFECMGRGNVISTSAGGPAGDCAGQRCARGHATAWHSRYVFATPSYQSPRKSHRGLAGRAAGRGRTACTGHVHVLPMRWPTLRPQAGHPPHADAAGRCLDVQGMRVYCAIELCKRAARAVPSHQGGQGTAAASPAAGRAPPDSLPGLAEGAPRRRGAAAAGCQGSRSLLPEAAGALLVIAPVVLAVVNLLSQVGV
jgi:hypothetical protein